jgi:hypothetical protein
MNKQQEAFNLNDLKIDALSYLTVQLLHTYPWWLPRKLRLEWARKDAIALLESSKI